MVRRLRHALPALLGLGGLCLPAVVHAQAYDQVLSPTVPGYDTIRGIEIPARPRTEYDPLGIQAGEYIIRPSLDESVGYTTNALGTNPAAGSAIVTTVPQILFNSNYGTNSIGGGIGLSNSQYLEKNIESKTDFNISLGANYQVGQDIITVAASDVYSHESPTDINSTEIIKPLGYLATDLRARYTTRVQDLQFEPNFEFQEYRFDDVTNPGATLSAKYRDRDTYAFGLTTRYGRDPARSIVFVVDAADSVFFASQNGAPRPNAIAYEALVGLDYAFSPNLQLLLLGGYELRYFSSRAYPNQSSPVVQGALIYAPTGLTTVTARVARSIEAAVGDSTTGVKLTQGSLIVDHEYLRNVLLQGRFSVIDSAYNIGNTGQTLFDAGASVSYLFNRNLRLTVTYDYFKSTGTNGNQANLQPAAALGTGTQASAVFTNQVVLVGFRFTL